MTDPRVNTVEKADRYVFLMDALREIGVTCVFSEGGKKEFKAQLKQFELNQQIITRLELAIKKQYDTLQRIDLMSPNTFSKEAAQLGIFDALCKVYDPIDETKINRLIE